MKQFIGCDAHKAYSVFVAVNEQGEAGRAATVPHERERFRQFLAGLPAGSAIALETTGYWYWMVDEMERAGHFPLLANAGQAKRLMGGRNKTDKLDARGLATLLRNGTLPVVWTAPAEIRDQRELTRTRLALSRIRTKLKNRIQAAFGRYGIIASQATDLFGDRGQRDMSAALKRLPPETRRAVQEQTRLLADVRSRIEEAEQRMKQIVRETPPIRLLQTLPGVGLILGISIAFEIGDITRFGSSGQLTSYAGLVPRVYSSGGRTRRGSVAQDVNRNLKWAFIEAANGVISHAQQRPWCPLVRLYQRLLARNKVPAVAAVAVARQLAECAFWILKKNEPYREPRSAAAVLAPVSAT